ncbi:MAG TPA: RsmE family RNA methyltransferase [Bryobacteraceae bacterium]|nr:RsmE family RNA methyltransferase [Bryobacteraceae bacterium]
MRKRFFVDGVRNGHAAIEGEDARHLTRVLRAAPGQRYEISDNSDVYLAEIESAQKERVIFRTIKRLEARRAGPRMILCPALIKFDRFEWMVEKATELGVSEIVPVEAARSERGLERAARKRLERWRRIALEASQQSRRAQLPELRQPVSLEAALLQPARFRLALDEEGAEGGARLTAILPREVAGADSIAILTGPEGGWTERERAALGQAGWTRVWLGPLILRTETAAIAALAVAGQSLAAG